MWRAEKCIVLVGAETVLTTTGPQTTPFHFWQYRADNGNMRYLGPTNPHGTAFASNQCLYLKRATSMESSKMHCTSRCRNSIYQCGAANYPDYGGSIGPRMKICETSGLPISMVQRFHQSNCYIKRNLQVWRVEKCIALVGAQTVLTSAGTQTTPFHGWQYRAENGNMRNFGPTNPHGTAFAP